MAGAVYNGALVPHQKVEGAGGKAVIPTLKLMLAISNLACSELSKGAGGSHLSPASTGAEKLQTQPLSVSHLGEAGEATYYRLNDLMRSLMEEEINEW